MSTLNLNSTSTIRTAKPRSKAAPKKADAVKHIYLTPMQAKVSGWAIGMAIPAFVFVLKRMALDACPSSLGKASIIALVVGGLAYSAPTVQAFIAACMPDTGSWRGISGRSLKAWGFVLLIEGTLVAPIPYKMVIPFVALAFLAAINGHCAATYAYNRLTKPSARK